MKYAIWPGEEFYERMRKSCRTEAETGVTMLLWRTGMHSSTLVKRRYQLTLDYCLWNRPKTGVTLRAKIPYAEMRVIKRCLAAGSLPTHAGTLRRWTTRIGNRAGYTAERVTPLTFRHSRAVWLLDGGMGIHRVAAVLGCSYAVLEKHYGQLEASRLVPDGPWDL